MHVKEYEPLASHSTFRLGGQARFFATIETSDDVENVVALADAHNLSLFILGKGSNCIFGDGVLPYFFVEMSIKGREQFGSTIKIGAGETLDEVIAWSLEKGLSGLEALSAIPGTVGASPVQNVGAYGKEIKDVLISLEAYDVVQKKMVTISKDECQFGYRSSIFNTTVKGRYIITAVIFQLKSITSEKIGGVSVPAYPSVQEYFKERNINDPTALEIRQAITAIRWSKLPNPSELPNVGSFFKNPIVERALAEQIKSKCGGEGMPTFSVVQGSLAKSDMVKIPAGFLLEKAGLKGKQFGNFAVYDKNALVLTHNGRGTLKELLEVRDQIIEKIKTEFGVTLEQEPAIVR